MEVKPRKIDYDALAEEIFWKAIEMAGGLGRLVEYRHLTWLPSLATASYVIALAEEGMLDRHQIAERLGITPETADRILKAKAGTVEEILEGKEEKEHKAGALARLAYESIKKEGHGLKLSGKELKSLESVIGDSAWALAVLKSVKGLDFPVSGSQLAERLSGISVHGKDAGELIRNEPEIKSPAELLKKLKELSMRDGN